MAAPTLPANLFQPLTDKALAMLWPIVAGILLAGIVRIVVTSRMERAGKNRRQARAGGDLAFGATILSFAIGWWYYLKHFIL